MRFIYTASLATHKTYFTADGCCSADDAIVDIYLDSKCAALF